MARESQIKPLSNEVAFRLERLETLIYKGIVDDCKYNFVNNIDFWIHEGFANPEVKGAENFIDYCSIRLGEFFIEKFTISESIYDDENDCTLVECHPRWVRRTSSDSRYYVEINGILFDPKAAFIKHLSLGYDHNRGYCAEIFFEFVYLYEDVGDFPSSFHPLNDLDRLTPKCFIARWGNMPPDALIVLTEKIKANSIDWLRWLPVETYEWFEKANWDAIYNAISWLAEPD